MKRILYLNILIAFVIILNSCSDKVILDGKWDDNIKLSVKKVEFSASTDSVTIKTGGSSWWVTDISVDTTHFYGFKGINLESDHYSIKQDCFIVERRNKNTLFIKVQENPNYVERVITVGLEAGDYFDRVTITQKAN